ncbi:MAG: HAD domain-containing protein [Bacteroidales bacterium]
MKNYLFLDFDGVLNTEDHLEYLHEQHLPLQDRYGYLFAPTAVACLQQIVEQTGAQIIVTSSWKVVGLQVLQQMWHERKLPCTLADITPTLPLSTTPPDLSQVDSLVYRGKEIELWLHTHAPTGSPYLILDDMDDILQAQKPHFICINPKTGITPNNAKEAIHILNNLQNLN